MMATSDRGRTFARFGLAAAVIATIAGNGSSAQVLFSEEWWEKRAKEQFKERLKHVYLNDDQEVRCPTFTGLIHSKGDRFNLIIPQYISVNMGTGKNRPYVTFANENCRYVVAVKRFDKSNGIETEIAPKKVKPDTAPDENLQKNLERQKQLREEAKQQPAPDDVKAMDPVQPVPLYNPPKPRPNDAQVMGATVDFDAPAGAIKFIGLLYFAPHSFSVRLVDVEDDLDIESSKNYDTKQYELSISNPAARFILAVTKEVYLNRWIKVLGE